MVTLPDGSGAGRRSLWLGAAAGGVFLAVLPVAMFATYMLIFVLGGYGLVREEVAGFCGSGPGFSMRLPGSMALSICLASSVALAAYSAYRAYRRLGLTRTSQFGEMERG